MQCAKTLKFIFDQYHYVYYISGFEFFFHILHQCIRMYDFKFETTCDRKLTEGQTTNNEIGYCTFAV